MTDNISTRELSLQMLIEINEKGQFSHIVLKGVLDKHQYLPKKERAFITRLTDGTMEHLIELDHIIDLFSKTKTKKMKPLIRNLMRMSVYQIKYMDSVPDAAVCNEAVKLAKKHKFGQLSGFVNGVLRNIARNINDIKYPDVKKEFNKYLSVRYSMPEWIVRKFIKDYGNEKTQEILAAFQSGNSISIRVNTAKCTPSELKDILCDEGVCVEEIEGLDYAFVISGFDYLNSLESFRNGLFYVQDVSSMMVAEYAKPEHGDHVIDVCAAPGGKSTHIAELLNGSGFVEARDLTDYKVSLIEENIKRHGLSNMGAVCMDATVFDEASVEKADILICDLPCSGLGVLGRKKDIRYKMTEQSLDGLAELQKEILDTVHTYVRKGKKLIYSTCTMNPAENEENVRWFINRYPEFELETSKQMFPKEIGNDGFFIAVLKRNGR